MVLLVEILFMRFDAWVVLCAGDEITIFNQYTIGDEAENLYL